MSGFHNLPMCFTQGCQDDPGIVQRAIRDVFKAIEQSPERDFLLSFSMMEIYNEVCSAPLWHARQQYIHIVLLSVWRAADAGA